MTARSRFAAVVLAVSLAVPVQVAVAPVASAHVRCGVGSHDHWLLGFISPLMMQRVKLTSVRRIDGGTSWTWRVSNVGLRPDSKIKVRRCV